MRVARIRFFEAAAAELAGAGARGGLSSACRVHELGALFCSATICLRDIPSLRQLPLFVEVALSARPIDEKGRGRLPHHPGQDDEGLEAPP